PKPKRRGRRLKLVMGGLRVALLFGIIAARTEAGMNHEDALIKAFIDPRRVERYLEIIANPKKRAKFTKELAHFKALDPAVMVSIPPSQRSPAAIASLLKAKGAETSVGSFRKTPNWMVRNSIWKSRSKKRWGIKWARSSRVFQESWDTSKTRMVVAY
ncbi:MAG: hypothetical protein WBV46_09360, partial [Terriglobales bacterium]